MTSKLAADCIFCKIIQGTIPSSKVLETKLSYAFLDLQPLSKGHVLVIPKHHAQFLHQVPDEHLADMLPVAKKIAAALGAENYNVLQNNGSLAHQAVNHVHFHIIPKPCEEQGLGVRWNSLKPTQEDLKNTLQEIQKKLEGNV
ncbi:HIT-like protein [Basidiobolus meristosporus CBS 931.73]|uniref:HIT-like protein n=1 Tax=Basidiobolus meristosporus CBS 931.73 TaxID=1314790 RepID=A0A1Y1X8V3_9FUNG|nr:HIT-like protein [Basidiobolus meristosporus CBS 931.73]|eukprot:ORX82162.1 HIT-like protein [Basidiobolus meristosporus CBS 931.73]